MTLFFTLHVLLTAVPIGHAFYNIPATYNTYKDERQPFVSLPISRKFDKVLRLNFLVKQSDQDEGVHEMTAMSWNFGECYTQRIFSKTFLAETCF